jgi:hypothetical protein
MADREPGRRAANALLRTVKAARPCSGLALALTLPFIAEAASVVTQHNDNARTGANLNETILRPSAVSSATFGKLFSQPVDGYIYPQPLYVENVLITTGPAMGTVHNVVYTATMHNSVYAFDADDNIGVNAMPLWQSQLGTSCVDCEVYPEVGIMSTPVIDLSTNTIYVVVKTTDPVSFSLHALDLGSGFERFGGPVTLHADLPGQGESSSKGILSFNARRVNNRPGLLLANGLVYIAFGALMFDGRPYHGWMLAQSASDLSWATAHVTTPNAAGSGIWMSANGPASDDQGNVYVMTGNSFDCCGYSGLDVRSGGSNLGESFVKLSPNLQVLDWFMPCLADQWDLPLPDGDKDLGASGPVLIPGSNALVGGGKERYLYALHRDSLGHYHGPLDACPNNEELSYVYQRLDVAPPAGEINGAPVFWTGPSSLFLWRAGDNARLTSYSVTQPSPPGIHIEPVTTAAPSSPLGGFLSLSANGNTDGIVWALSSNTSGDGVLRAFDASNVGNELWNSGLNPDRDSIGVFADFNSPTVVNGKVYVGSFSNVLHVYGLLPDGLER